MSCKFDCFQKLLEQGFYNYGKFLANNPFPFLFIPLIITAVAGVGLLKLEVTDDTEYLYTPTNGPAKQERQIIKKYFQENDTYLFMPTRKTDLDGFLQVIITDRKGGNIYTGLHLEKIIYFDRHLQSTNHGNSSIRYWDVCASFKGSCLENVIFTILNGSGDSIYTSPISYPQHNNIYFLAQQLGGVKVNEQGFVISAEAVFLSYFVRHSTSEDEKASNEWLANVKNYLLDYYYYDKDLVVNFQTSLSIDEELGKATEGIGPKFALTYSILFTFCAISCVMSDWVRTKVWVVMGGQLAAAMAVVTSFGILSAAGVPFATTVASMPFLIAGIGIDDMFVILSSWRHTSYTLPYQERMAQTMKVAAISITVTSITDALAFGVGSITVFRAVSFFCAYTGVAVIFSYIYAITFLAACFALSGKGEQQNKHEITCNQVLPLSKAEGKSKIYKILCAGGDNVEDMTDPPSHTKYKYPGLTVLIRTYIAPFLMRRSVKLTTLFLYCVYIGFAIWGCTTLKEGLKLRNLALSTSYVIPYYDMEEKYFKSLFGPRVMVAITEPLDYSSQSVRSNVNEQLNIFRNNSLFYSEEGYVESWLSSFTVYLQMTNQNPTNISSFIHILRTQFFLNPPFDRFTLDVKFNNNFTQIIASRFFLQAKGEIDALDSERLMTTSRDIADKSKFEMTVYHPTFIYIDQFPVILGNTLQNLGIAVGSMLIVSLLLLPSLISAVCVTVSVVSICVGVIGYMAFWDINLDSVSMINLIMCIGFSVDFSAHISYHFAISEEPTGNLRAIEALGHIGTPIVQGAMSTILAVVILSTSKSYIFITFFKIMFLVMVFGFAHAMFLLPVVLSFIPNKCRSHTRSQKYVMNQNGLANDSKHNIMNIQNHNEEILKELKPNASLNQEKNNFDSIWQETSDNDVTKANEDCISWYENVPEKLSSL